MPEPRFCKWCNTELPVGRRKFCNRDCTTRWWANDPTVKERKREYTKRLWREDPEKMRAYAREYYFWAQYRITPEQRANLIAKGCEICGKKSKNIFIDHEHESGKMRGALCANCNSGLGHFMEDADLLLAAIKYLEERQDPL